MIDLWPFLCEESREVADENHRIMRESLANTVAMLRREEHAALADALDHYAREIDRLAAGGRRDLSFLVGFIVTTKVAFGWRPLPFRFRLHPDHDPDEIEETVLRFFRPTEVLRELEARIAMQSLGRPDESPEDANESPRWRC